MWPPKDSSYKPKFSLALPYLLGAISNTFEKYKKGEGFKDERKFPGKTVFSIDIIQELDFEYMRSDWEEFQKNPKPRGKIISSEEGKGIVIELNNKMMAINYKPIPEDMIQLRWSGQILEEVSKRCQLILEILQKKCQVDPVCYEIGTDGKFNKYLDEKSKHEASEHTLTPLPFAHYHLVIDPKDMKTFEVNFKNLIAAYKDFKKIFDKLEDDEEYRIFNTLYRPDLSLEDNNKLFNGYRNFSFQPIIDDVVKSLDKKNEHYGKIKHFAEALRYDHGQLFNYRAGAKGSFIIAECAIKSNVEGGEYLAEKLYKWVNRREKDEEVKKQATERLAELSNNPHLIEFKQNFFFKQYQLSAAAKDEDKQKAILQYTNYKLTKLR